MSEWGCPLTDSADRTEYIFFICQSSNISRADTETWPTTRGFSRHLSELGIEYLVAKIFLSCFEIHKVRPGGPHTPVSGGLLPLRPGQLGPGGDEGVGQSSQSPWDQPNQWGAPGKEDMESFKELRTSLIKLFRLSSGIAHNTFLPFFTIS